MKSEIVDTNKIDSTRTRYNGIITQIRQLPVDKSLKITELNSNQAKCIQSALSKRGILRKDYFITLQKNHDDSYVLYITHRM